MSVMFFKLSSYTISFVLFVLIVNLSTFKLIRMAPIEFMMLFHIVIWTNRVMIAIISIFFLNCILSINDFILLSVLTDVFEKLGNNRFISCSSISIHQRIMPSTIFVPIRNIMLSVNYNLIKFTIVNFCWTF